MSPDLKPPRTKFSVIAKGTNYNGGPLGLNVAGWNGLSRDRRQAEMKIMIDCGRLIERNNLRNFVNGKKSKEGKKVKKE